MNVPAKFVVSIFYPIAYSNSCYAQERAEAKKNCSPCWEVDERFIKVTLISFTAYEDATIKYATNDTDANIWFPVKYLGLVLYVCARIFAHSVGLSVLQFILPLYIETRQPRDLHGLFSSPTNARSIDSCFSPLLTLPFDP